MDSTELAERLLAGPRGRRLCLDLTSVSPLDHSTRVTTDQHGDPNALFLVTSGERYAEHVADSVAEELLTLDQASLTALVQGDRVLEALANSVTWATYWQSPDADDLLLEDRRVIEALIPVAATVVATTAVDWWSSPVLLDHQQVVTWLELGQKRGAAAALNGTPLRLTAWRAQTQEEERRAATRPKDLSLNYSGFWWSTPALYAVKTTRSLGPLPAVQLALVEDPQGFDSARVARVQPAPGCQIFEINEADDWVEMVRRYPLDVRWSRRHDWWRTTGCAGPWLIPDWAAVGNDYDGVHLTVLGYLSTAGRALALGDAYTLLAGFDPDATYWLNDVLTQATEPLTWYTNQEDPLNWSCEV